MKRRRLWILMWILVAGTAAYAWWEIRLERKYTPQIRAAALRYGVDPLLVKAVVWRESRFRAETRGRKGEIGLMQIQEIPAQEWADAEGVRSFGHEHCLDPGTNTLAGACYLARLLKRYAQTDNPVPYALADYNAGRGNVLRWNTGAAATNGAAFIEQIGFPGTKHYVKSVLRRHSIYRFLSRMGWS